MRSFAELVTPVVSRHAQLDAASVLELLGSAAREDLERLDVRQRAALVDRLVRNLRGLSVTHAPDLERALLKETGAEPHGTLRWELKGAAALVELRSGVRYLGTWLGYGWADLSRLQAVISGLARWVQSSGSGRLTATVGEQQVRFAMVLKVAGFDRKLVEASPFVQAVGDAATGLEVLQTDEGMQVGFTVVAR